MIRIANFFSAPLLAISLAACAAQQHTTATTRPHNVIIFVADGLRYGSVNVSEDCWNFASKLNRFCERVFFVPFASQSIASAA